MLALWAFETFQSFCLMNFLAQGLVGCLHGWVHLVALASDLYRKLFCSIYTFFCDIRLGNRTDSSLLGSLFSMKTLLQRLLVSFYSGLILAARCPPGWSPFLGGNTGQKIQIKSSQIKTGRSLPNYSYVKQTQLGEINKITGQIRIE